MITVTTQLNVVPLVTLQRTLPRQLDRAVDGWAESIAAEARDAAHVITGAMRTSTGVLSAVRDDYSARTNAAAGLNPAGETLPAPPRPEGHSAVVAVGMAYAVYEEYGTERRGPHPWFTPAVERGRAEAESRLARAWRTAEGAG